MTPVHVENGARLRVESAIFTGVAGVLFNPMGGELACRADAPIGEFDAVASIDGRQARITSVRRSDHNARSIIARFDWADLQENAQ